MWDACETASVFTWVLRVDGRRVLNQVDLESNEMRSLSHLVENRDHCKQIHERLATFPVVDKTDLRFRLCVDAILQVQDGIIVAILSLDPSRDLAIR
jgi:hypothetical protein